MPELPEVETTCRALQPLLGSKITDVVVRHHQLRYPVPSVLSSVLRGSKLVTLKRRAKYLLFNYGHGTIITHLGMSGSLRITSAGIEPEKHDHVDFCFDTGACLRLRDPRRFGSILWTTDDPLSHSLLKKLGPEPFDSSFNGEYLYTQALKRTMPIKQFIMDGEVVVGVGNIYANEALFLAKINPLIKANKVSKIQINRLVKAIISVLTQAIESGGTTLRDFFHSDGRSGYFQQQLNVYGRAGQVCTNCKNGRVKEVRLGQRSTFFCTHCQR